RPPRGIVLGGEVAARGGETIDVVHDGVDVLRDPPLDREDLQQGLRWFTVAQRAVFVVTVGDPHAGRALYIRHDPRLLWFGSRACTPRALRRAATRARPRRRSGSPRSVWRLALSPSCRRA